MKFDFQEIRQWLSQDVSQIFRLRAFSLTYLARVYPSLQHLYYVVWTLSLFIVVGSLIAFLPIWKIEESVKNPVSNYTRHRSGKDSGDDRLVLMQALSLAGVESRDPAWMEWRAFADCIGVNARPDLAKPLVIWSWSHSGKTFEIPQGDIFYVNSDSLSKSSLCDESKAQSGFRMVKAFHEQSQMVVEIEILKNRDGIFESVEKFKLVRPLSAQSQDSSLTVLKRMQVKWYGPDEFLIEHGSSGQSDWKLTQHLEFGAGSRMETVSLFPGQALIKQKQTMVAQTMGALTQGLQIWVVEDVEPAGLRFRAWSVSGLYSEAIVIPRQSEQWQPKVLQDQISLSAVRSAQQVSIRILNQRWNLQLFDWMLHTPTGWIKIVRPQQIDDYVAGILTGELLILRSIEHESDGWKSSFRLYSQSHSQKVDFSLKQQEVPTSNEASPVQKPSLPVPVHEKMETEEYFVPVKAVENDKDQWDPNDVRAWEPPVAPHAMREILQSVSQK